MNHESNGAHILTAFLWLILPTAFGVAILFFGVFKVVSTVALCAPISAGMYISKLAMDNRLPISAKIPPAIFVLLGVFASIFVLYNIRIIHTELAPLVPPSLLYGR